MSLLFLSHSSHNNAEALALRDWLLAEGWSELFLDLDPERGIVAGERWEKALHQAASRCDAVLFLVSQKWLASDWCRREFHLAQRLNKRIFILLIDDIPITELPRELTESWQLVNLATGSDHGQAREAHLPGSLDPSYVYFSQSGLQRLRTGLQKAGLDPQSFPWPPEHDPERPPYRGLRPLEAEDAGIFFGREAPIIELLAQVRGLREGVPPRFLAILGASGAGKSSFLRAGILPRLKRDERFFLPLPVLRPEQAVLSGVGGLLACLQAACQQCQMPVTRKQLQQAIKGGADTLRPLLDQLARKAQPPAFDGQPGNPPTLVLAIDQGEELFLAEGGTEAQEFLALLGELLREEPPALLALFTIRSDSYDPLQSATALQGIPQKTFSLPPMPRGAYQQIIEEPAKLLARSSRPLKIEPQLTAALLGDIDRGGGKDALPLLAFTLQQLYLDYGGDGDLRLDEYADMGRIEGAIGSAVAQALKDAQANPKLPSDAEECLKLLRRGLIPWLAGIDPQTNLPRRRVAKLAEVPEEARAIIQHFVEHRLLATDKDEAGEVTIEPAHEALLRQWSALRGWLEDDAAALATLESVKAASRDWEANTKDPKWLIHQAGRLEDAEALRQRADLEQALTPAERDYLHACRVQQDERTALELQQARALAEAQTRVAASQRRVVQRTRAGLVVAAALLVITLLAALKAMRNHEQALWHSERAKQNFVETTGLRLAYQAQSVLHGNTIGRDVDALKLMISAYRLHPASEVFSALDVGRSKLQGTDWIAEADSPITSMALSADGHKIALAGDDGLVRLLSPKSGTPIGSPWRGHVGAVRTVEFSPDSQKVVSGGDDSQVRLWRVNGTQQVIRRSSGHMESITSISFPYTNSEFVSASFDGILHLWNTETGQPIGEPFGGSYGLLCATFAPDGRSLVFGSGAGKLLVWDSESKMITGEIYISGVARSIAFSPDGRHLLSGSDSGVLQLWDAAREALTAESEKIVSLGNGFSMQFPSKGTQIGDPIDAHKGTVTSVAFNADGSAIVTGGSDKAVRLWDTSNLHSTGQSLNGHQEAVISVGFSKDGLAVFSASTDRTLRRWRLGEQVSRSKVLVESLNSVEVVAIDRLGRRIVSAGGVGDSNALRLWDAETGAPLGEPLLGHRSTVSSVAYSPDGRRIVSGSWDDTLRLWDAETGAPLGEPLLGHRSTVTSVAFSSDGRRIASGSWDTTLRLWDAETGDPLGKPLLGHKESVTSVAFSPDGRRIISGGGDGTLRLWDAETGAPLGEPLLGHRSAVTSVAFSPDGRRIASSSWDETLRLWDAETGAPLGEPLLGHEGAVMSVVFSPDSRWIVSSSLDTTTLRLWDAETGTSLGEPMSGHDKPIKSVAFSPDNRRIISASDDGTIRLWPAPAAWADELCKKLTRNMSQREWDEWVSPDIPYVVQCPDRPIPEADGTTPP